MQRQPWNRPLCSRMSSRISNPVHFGHFMRRRLQRGILGAADDRLPSGESLRDSLGERGGSATQRIENLFQAFVYARKDRCVAERVPAALGFPQGHDEIEEVLGFIRLKGHHPFLVIEPE